MQALGQGTGRLSPGRFPAVSYVREVIRGEKTRTMEAPELRRAVDEVGGYRNFRRVPSGKEAIPSRLSTKTSGDRRTKGRPRFALSCKEDMECAEL
ncbi:hypothetical protein GCWU000246_01520 [Jonquetella anthropi E3_33 E1]|nr:hypothetical protein GCWU000246_01520 [Jonquetella anthropi E3_33 E1]